MRQINNCYALCANNVLYNKEDCERMIECKLLRNIKLNIKYILKWESSQYVKCYVYFNSFLSAKFNELNLLQMMRMRL